MRPPQELIIEVREFLISRIDDEYAEEFITDSTWGSVRKLPKEIREKIEEYFDKKEREKNNDP